MSTLTPPPPATPQFFTFTVPVTHEIDYARVADLLCCAFEGGSNYWYEITERHAPAHFDFYSNADLGREAGAPPKVYPHLDYPLNPGGHLLIKAVEDGGYTEVNGAVEWALDLGTVKAGLLKLAEEYPSSFSDFVNENEDAETGDVFLQLCLFGEVIFG